MPKPTAKQKLKKRLEDFKRRKINRTLEEAADLLKDWGFAYRKATKEQGGVWTRGTRRVVLPKPHGGDNVLRPRYISIIIAEIEAAELEAPLEIN